MGNPQFVRPQEKAGARAPQRPTRPAPQSRRAAQAESLDSAPLSVARVMAMQQLLGNRAVSHFLQRELTVGPADDTHEREADHVAAQVMRAPASQPAAERAGAPAPAVQSTGGARAGAALPLETRADMEARFGADFSHVRVHTGSAPAQINRSLDAEAFTHQNDIYMGAGAYNPHSASGRQLLAHELTHVVQQTGTVQRKSNKAAVRVQGKLPAQRVSTKAKKKLYLDFIRMKRLDPQFDKIIAKKLGMKKLADKKGDQSGGTFGHWWTEIGDLQGAYPGTWKAIESYGWWPKGGVTSKKVFKGVEGELNAGDDNDPHHGEDVKDDQMFHPVMELDPGATDYVATRSKVIDDVRKFSRGYSGKWNWAFGWGKNCHTFQQALKTSVGLHFQKGAGWLKKPDTVEGVSETAKKEKEKATNERWNADNPGIDYRLHLDLPTSEGQLGNSEKIRIPADSIVRILTDGIDLDRTQGYNHVQIAWDKKIYSAYYDDVKRAGDPV